MQKEEWGVYKALHEKVFKKWDSTQRPQIVILSEEDGETTGFATFILMNTDTAYIQYVGCIKDKRGQKMWKVLDEAMGFIKKQFGCNWFSVKIHFRNKQALVVALMNDFVIHGFTHDHVEFYKERK
jgi:hypothetical protein